MNDAGAPERPRLSHPRAGAGDQLGSATAVIGDIPFVQDFNDDGIDDLAVSAVSAAGGNGVTYVVYGGTGAGILPTWHWGDTTRFMAITGKSGAAGAVTTGNAGSSLAGVPDFNDDSHGDLLIGAPELTTTAATTLARRTWSTAAAARSRRREPGDPGSAGFRIDGAAASDALGDVGSARPATSTVTTRATWPYRRCSPIRVATLGRVYLIYATAENDPADVDLAQLKAGAADPRGLQIDGAAAEDRLRFAQLRSGGGHRRQRDRRPARSARVRMPRPRPASTSRTWSRRASAPRRGPASTTGPVRSGAGRGRWSRRP